VASVGAAARVDALPVDTLTIQSGQIVAVASVEVGGGGNGDGCALGGIFSWVRNDDTVVGAGIPKLKSMAAPEKGPTDTRAATTGVRVVALADTGGAKVLVADAYVVVVRCPVRLVRWMWGPAKTPRWWPVLAQL
jgi:hypothetical protein